MKIFLTGGSGFLGSHVLKTLVDENHEITILVNKTSIPENLKKPNLRIIKGNLLEKETFKKELLHIDLILHIAASVKSDIESYKNNILITRNLVDLSMEMKIKNFLFISTRGTIGISSPTTLSNDNSNNFENLKYADNYLKSKIECERILNKYLKGISNLIILCPTALIGPNDNRPTPIGLLLKNIINNKIKFYIDGYINLIDVRDASKIICEIIKTKNFESGKYGFGYKNMMLSELFSKLKKAKKKIILPYKLPNFIVNLIQLLIFFIPLVDKINPFLSNSRIKKLREGYSCFENSEKIKNLKIKNIDFSKTLNDIVVYFNEE